MSVFWGKYRKFSRCFCSKSVLGTPPFALKEIFKIIHHSSLFVWVLSESWRHLCATLLERRSLKKKNQGLNGIRTHDLREIPARCSTNWATKPHIGGKVNLLSSYLPVQWNHVKHTRNNSYLSVVDESEAWSSIFQFKQLERRSLKKKSGPHHLSNCLNWKIYCDDHVSLSSTTAVQIWIISCVFHMTSLHGKIWTQ